MTTVNGNLQDGDWRAYMIYETESTRETYTVKVTSAGTYISNVTWINQAWSTTVSATGQSSVSKSIGATYLTKGDRKKLVSATFKWNKGTSSSTKTVTVRTVNTTTGNSSTAKVEITVPALTKYTVRYYSNGGTGAPSQQAKYYGRDLKISSVKPKRTGWTFLGWAESADAVKASRQPSSVYKSNASISLYAVWKKTLTLSYSSAEGTGATGLPQPQSADIYNSTSSYIFTIPSEAPSRDLYEFLGWSTDETVPTVSYHPGDTIDVRQDTVLHAVWKLAYRKPVITLKSALRCNDKFSPSDEGTYGIITVDWAVDDINADIKADSLTVECTNNGNVGIICPEIDKNSKSGTTEIRLSGLNKDTRYEFSITVKDNSSNKDNSATCPAFISVAYFTMDFSAGGYGVGIGCSAGDGNSKDNANFKCAMNSQFMIGNGMKTLLDIVYPVGSYLYTSLKVNDFDPNKYYGGKWELIKQRVFLLASDKEDDGDLNKTGGSAKAVAVPEHSHEIKAVSIPEDGAHRHEYTFTKDKWGASIASGVNNVLLDSAKHNALTNVSQVKSQTHTHTVPAHKTEIYSSGDEEGNMPPYIIANLWHRKA